MKSQNIEIALLDRSGVFLVDYDPYRTGSIDIRHDFEVLLEKNLAAMGVEMAEKAVDRQTGYQVCLHARKKIDQLGGYVHSKGALGYLGLEWSVLIRLDNSHVVPGVTLVQKPALLILAGTLIAAMVFSSFFSKALTGPIQKVLNSIEYAAKGDLTHAPQVSSRDEIGDMAGKFRQVRSGVRATAENTVKAAPRHRKWRRWRAPRRTRRTLHRVSDGRFG